MCVCVCVCVCVWAREFWVTIYCMLCASLRDIHKINVWQLNSDVLVTHDLKFDGLSIQFYCSNFLIVYGKECVCVCMCVCVIWGGWVRRQRDINKNIHQAHHDMRTLRNHTVWLCSFKIFFNFSIKFTKLYHSAKNWVDSNTSIVLAYPHHRTIHKPSTHSNKCP